MGIGGHDARRGTASTWRAWPTKKRPPCWVGGWRGGAGLRRPGRRLNPSPWSSASVSSHRDRSALGTLATKRLRPNEATDRRNPTIIAAAPSSMLCFVPWNCNSPIACAVADVSRPVTQAG
jgi:hypothetical protein